MEIRSGLNTFAANDFDIVVDEFNMSRTAFGQSDLGVRTKAAISTMMTIHHRHLVVVGLVVVCSPQVRYQSVGNSKHSCLSKTICLSKTRKIIFSIGSAYFLATYPWSFPFKLILASPQVQVMCHAYRATCQMCEVPMVPRTSTMYANSRGPHVLRYLYGAEG